MVTLGDKVQDKLTGFPGTVTGLAHYLSSPNGHVQVTGQFLSDGKPVVEWFDAERLEAREPAPAIPGAAGGDGNAQVSDG